MPRDRMRIRMLLGEPILHFLLIGLALFAAYRWLSPRDSAGHQIVITEGVMNDLVAQHVAAKGRPPAADELTHLIDAYVREEILYREGVALGLDRDDIVVKRRVRQKLEVMVEEDAAAVVPTEAELSAYLAANKDQFFQPAILPFDQIFLGPATAGPEVVRATALTRDAVRNGINPLSLGQPSLLPRRIAQSPADLVARDFGSSFALAVESAPVGEWVGPIDSSFGAHYLRIDKPEDTVTLAVQMATLPDGAMYAATTTLDAKAKNITVVITNSGHKPMAK